jgi:uncharacterized membrane protein
LTALPVASYGIVLTGAAIAYSVLTQQLIAVNGHDSRLARAVGNDRKGKLSLALYIAASGLAFLWPWVAIALYIGVALVWVVPDTRIESLIRNRTPSA